MNRTIKFRAWIKSQLRMTEVTSISLAPGRGGVMVPLSPVSDNPNEHIYTIFREWDDIELMQFTGLVDACRQEIYEGDVLAYDQNFRDQIVGYVEWRCNRWDIKTPTGTIELIGGGSLYCVIGNIYEQPELLEERT